MTAYLPMILFTVLTNALAQIFLKQGMLATGQFSFTADGIVAAMPRLALNPFLAAGMAMFVISMASHLLVLSRVELSFAYPFLSLAYVVVTIASYFFFGETVSAYRIAGVIFICAGTILIARS